MAKEPANKAFVNIVPDCRFECFIPHLPKVLSLCGYALHKMHGSSVILVSIFRNFVTILAPNRLNNYYYQSLLLEIKM